MLFSSLGQNCYFNKYLRIQARMLRRSFNSRKPRRRFKFRERIGLPSSAEISIGIVCFHQISLSKCFSHRLAHFSHSLNVLSDAANCEKSWRRIASHRVSIRNWNETVMVDRKSAAKMSFGFREGSFRIIWNSMLFFYQILWFISILASVCLVLFQLEMLRVFWDSWDFWDAQDSFGIGRYHQQLSAAYFYKLDHVVFQKRILSHRIMISGNMATSHNRHLESSPAKRHDFVS